MAYELAATWRWPTLAQMNHSELSHMAQPWMINVHHPGFIVIIIIIIIIKWTVWRRMTIKSLWHRLTTKLPLSLSDIARKMFSHLFSKIQLTLNFHSKFVDYDITYYTCNCTPHVLRKFTMIRQCHRCCMHIYSAEIQVWVNSES